MRTGCRSSVVLSVTCWAEELRGQNYLIPVQDQRIWMAGKNMLTPGAGSGA
jgi:hypothetical protein